MAVDPDATMRSLTESPLRSLTTTHCALKPARKCLSAANETGCAEAEMAHSETGNNARRRNGNLNAELVMVASVRRVDLTEDDSCGETKRESPGSACEAYHHSRHAANRSAGHSYRIGRQKCARLRRVGCSVARISQTTAVVTTWRVMEDFS
jgi:hypothetical protein